MKPLLFVLSIAAVLAVASDAPAGGIDDAACPNVAGENTNTCPSGTVGTPYRIRFIEREGSGCGPGKQTFHHDSGVLPPGLALSLSGTLSGMPERAGTFRFYVEMLEPKNEPDCSGKETQKQFTLRVREPAWLVDPVVPAGSEVGVPFRMTLRARGGTGIFSWRLVGGRLPTGLRLGTNGSILGTPRTAGSYGLTARAWDTEGRDVSWTGTLAVAARLLIRTERLPAAKAGRPYRAILTAAGGVAPKVWRVERGRLPRGVRLDRALGRLVGTPREAGRYRITVGVTDGLQVESTRTLTIAVREGPSRLGERFP